jgi:RHS repeat-associated protein
LCIVDGSDPNLLKSSYVYADAQPVCMRVHSQAAPTDPNLYEPHWYVHDRLGSVRQVVKLNEFSRTQVENRYAYTPFGEDLAAVTAETIANPFQFTGQWYDEEIEQYYLRARMYDPAIMRFTARDPLKNSPKTPLTINKYLYCLNDPTNNLDLDGKMALQIMDVLTTGAEVHAAVIGTAAYGVSQGDWRFIQLGIIMEQMAAPAIAMQMMALKPNISARFLSGGKMFDTNQRALVALAKEAQRSGISKTEAKIMLEWADEYGLKLLNHIDMEHWIGGPHIHIGPINHIPVP